MDRLKEKGKGKAIQLQDCECIGLRIVEKINGELVALDLREVFSQSGVPTAIIKDGDSSLRKGVRLYSESLEKPIPVVEDIGHVLANALKAEFKDEKKYKKFLTLISKGSRKLRQTNLAYLIPPKIRQKGRFQSIGNLCKWSIKMLDFMAVIGAAEKSSSLDRVRKAFPKFSLLKNFIESFSKTVKASSDIMGILKNKGLNQENYLECLKLADNIPKQSRVKKRLLEWLDRHIAIQNDLSTPALLVSSDIIESLFGKFKHVIERGSQADMNRTALLIPALCGQTNLQESYEIFNQTRHKDIKTWEEKNITYTIRKQRQQFFNKKSQIPVK
jgi:hypothetical protein